MSHPRDVAVECSRHHVAVIVIHLNPHTAQTVVRLVYFYLLNDACLVIMMFVSLPLSPSVPQDKEVDLEQVQQRFSGLISDDDLSHKQLPASPLDVSTLDVGTICQRQDSRDTMPPFPPGALSVPSLYSESGVGGVASRNMPLPLSSSTLPPPSRCKHRAPNGGILHQSPIKMPVKYQPVPSRAMDTNHGTSI